MSQYSEWFKKAEDKGMKVFSTTYPISAQLISFSYPIISEALLTDKTLNSFYRTGEYKHRDLFILQFETKFPEFKIVFQTDNEKYYIYTDGIKSIIEINIMGNRHDRTTFYSSDPDTTSLLSQFLTENIIPIKDRSAQVYVLSAPQTGLELTSIGSIDDNLIRENYSTDILEKYDYSVKQLSSPEPFGKFCLLHGLPGTGKTHLIKGMFKELNKNVLIIMPSSMVSTIDGPSMINVFSNYNSEFDGKYITLVIEDADSCIANRESGNASTISTLLNMSDGILGNCFNIRIIATTNAEHIDVDPALKRPGRMISTIHVDELYPDKASEIFHRLTGKEKEYKDSLTLSEIYEDANKELGKAMVLEKEEPERKMGF